MTAKRNATREPRDQAGEASSRSPNWGGVRFQPGLACVEASYRCPQHCNKNSQSRARAQHLRCEIRPQHLNLSRTNALSKANVALFAPQMRSASVKREGPCCASKDQVHHGGTENTEKTRAIFLFFPVFSVPPW